MLTGGNYHCDELCMHRGVQIYHAVIVFQLGQNQWKQEGIPVGCVLPALYLTGRGSLFRGGVSVPLPVNRKTGACENITLLPSFGGGNYYRPQRSCGQGYVFTRVCDSVHREGGLRAGRTPPPREQTPRSIPLPPQSRTPSPPEAHSSIRSTSGRYASYWNAFLYLNISGVKSLLRSTYFTWKI